MSAPSEPGDGRAAGWLHDGQSAVRHEVTVAIDGAMLAIDGFAPVPLAVLQRLDAARPAYGRRDLAGWRLGFDTDPPASILRHLPAPPRYGGVIDRVGLWPATAIGLVVSALVLIGAVQGMDLVARAIPYSWEQRLGDAISGDFGAQACREPRAQQQLAALAARLSPAGRAMRVSVVDLPFVNAVALPGGRILLFRGLIDQARSPDEVAGVLAHEIGHVERRHVLLALLRRFGVGMLLGSGGRAGEYGQALLEFRYSRAAESEADAYAIKHLIKAGISPAATAKLFERLGREEAGMPGVFVYLASHPPSAKRQRRFGAAARGMAHAQPALSREAWAEVRAMCAHRNEEDGRETHFRL